METVSFSSIDAYTALLLPYYFTFMLKIVIILPFVLQFFVKHYEHCGYGAVYSKLLWCNL